MFPNHRLDRCWQIRSEADPMAPVRGRGRLCSATEVLRCLLHPEWAYEIETAGDNAEVRSHLFVRGSDGTFNEMIAMSGTPEKIIDLTYYLVVIPVHHCISAELREINKPVGIWLHFWPLGYGGDVCLCCILAITYFFLHNIESTIRSSA